jgi:hypothetical protein
VHGTPYVKGWLARVRLADFQVNLAALVHVDAGGPTMAHHAWLQRAQE